MLHPQLETDCFTVCELELCRVLLMNDRHYPWCILVPKINDVREIFELSEQDQQLLARESAQLSRTMMSLFKGEKMNVAALGNMVPQLHVHHIVRKERDPAWPKPVWGCVPSEPYDDETAKVLCNNIGTALLE